jgi:hypothetical protein
MNIDAQQARMLSSWVKQGELIWDAEDGSERYCAILDLEDAGLISPPLVERSDRFRWPLTRRGQSVAESYLRASHTASRTVLAA